MDRTIKTDIDVIARGRIFSENPNLRAYLRLLPVKGFLRE